MDIQGHAVHGRDYAFADVEGSADIFDLKHGTRHYGPPLAALHVSGNAHLLLQ